MAQEPLSMNQYLRWVAVEHPAIKEAKQRWLQSQNLLLMAKGNFDPSLNFAMDRKKFDGKNYYTISENQLTIPTRLGLNLKLDTTSLQVIF
jgi:hypothetical protein